MKQILNLSKIILVVVLILSASRLSATILTVSNNTAISAQYTSVSAAFTAANPGDTVFIHGSPTSYGDVTLNKPLVVIGPGYIPTNPTGYAAQLGYFYLDTLNGVSGTSGTYIAGLYMYSLSETNNYNGKTISNITVRRNQFSSYLYIGYSNTIVHNWLIEENLINSLSYNINTTSSTNILVNNNIISYTYNVYKTIFSNNVLYYNATFSQCTVQNSIFVCAAATNGSSNNTFNNNLFSSAITFTVGTNTFSPAGQATTNSDPQFNGGTATNYLSISDYTLKAASAGHNAGTDGTDLGIYGSTGFNWGGTPPVPMIYYYNLKPNYVKSNGTLNITVSVKNQ